MGRLPQTGCPIPPDMIGFRQTARGCLVSLPLEAGEQIYGLGLQLRGFNHTGQKKTLRVNSDPIANTGDSHAPVPFYVSTRGYGVLIDTLRYASFYFSSHTPLGAAGQQVDETPNVLATETENLYAGRPQVGARAVIDIPAARGVDVYVFSGPTMCDAVRRYVLFSGGGCIPALWGLGGWYRGFGKDDARSSLALAKSLRESRMPCQVFGLEPGWQSQAYSCSYVWSPERYPDPDVFVGEMRGMGYELNLWEHAFVHPSSPLYAPVKEGAGDTEVWSGAVPDLTLPCVRKAFGEYHGRCFLEHGITGFNLDECDNSDFIGSPWSFPEYSEFPSGMDGEQMHSLFGLAYQRTHDALFRQRNTRTYSEVRSSHALAAPYPFVLYSDLYDHAEFIRGVANMGFSGLLWCPEVRQCASEEDLVRRLQTVVFSPQALVNAWMIPNPPWLQFDSAKNHANEFLPGHEVLTARCRRWLEIRMSVVPYLYSAFYRYWQEGVPPFRALVMDYPDDPKVHRIDNAYLMGESLLVAPVIAGQAKRAVYLPRGGWFDLFTGERFDGEREYLMDVPLDRLPVFVKEGAVLPWAEPLMYLQRDTVFDVTAVRYGDGPASGMLFGDDGYSFGFEEGLWYRLILDWDGTKGHVRHEGRQVHERYRIGAWKSVTEWRP